MLISTLFRRVALGTASVAVGAYVAHRYGKGRAKDELSSAEETEFMPSRDVEDSILSDVPTVGASQANALNPYDTDKPYPFPTGPAPGG